MWTDPFCALLSHQDLPGQPQFLRQWTQGSFVSSCPSPCPAPVWISSPFSMVLGKRSAERNFSSVLVECAAAQPAVPAGRGVWRVGAAPGTGGEPGAPLVKPNPAMAPSPHQLLLPGREGHRRSCRGCAASSSSEGTEIGNKNPPDCSVAVSCFVPRVIPRQLWPGSHLGSVEIPAGHTGQR